MKNFAFLFVTLLIAMHLAAQSPQAFKYQAVARDASGNVLANKAVSFRISILSGSPTGTAAYVELFTGKTTNAFGLVEMEIGKGTPQSGSFLTIPWYNSSFYVKVEMDPAGGSSYTHLGTSQLLSVPYALHAKNVELEADGDAMNEIQVLSLTGTQLTLSKGGGTVTLPSSGGGDNWGTDVVKTDATLTGNGTTALPLKIAQQSATAGQVLKWSGSTWAPANDATGGASGPWLSSGSDIYFNAGKVAIGKIPGIDARQFQVLTDSYQAIAGENNSATYATIYAKNLGTGPAAEFRSKIKITDGTEGTGKVLTSDAAGYTSWQLPAISVDAANFTGNGSTASPLKLSPMGASDGQVLKWTGTAWDNANDDAGPWKETADYIYCSLGKNFGMGINVPSRKLTIAEASTSCYMNIVNSSTGYNQSDGLIMGMQGLHGWVTTYESGNLYLGTAGTARVFIASDGDVGIGIATPSTKLDVNGVTNLRGNTSDVMMTCSSAEAIWYNGTYYSWGYGGTYNYFGDKIRIGGDGNLAPAYTLYVDGTAAKSSAGTAWVVSSDLRLKNIRGNYSKGLREIQQLQPVLFSYKENNPRKLPTDEGQIGFIAQDVQKVFPEAVNMGEDGYLDFDIHAVNVALVNAVKELKAENDLLKQKNTSLENEYASLKSRLEKIEAAIGINASVK